MKPNGKLCWDINLVAEALKISIADSIKYFTDGRKVSFLMERRIAKEVLKGHLPSSEGASYDVITPDGKKYEVRSITRGGVYFCPSYMVGSGRKFEEEGFITKLDEIEGYVLSDVTLFPNIPFWIINKNIVSSWYEEGLLGSGTKISRINALQKLKDI